MIDQVIDTANSLEPDKIVVVIGYKYKLLESHLNSFDINFAYQFNQKGTGHAVSKTKDFFSGNSYVGFMSTHYKGNYILQM